MLGIAVTRACLSSSVIRVMGTGGFREAPVPTIAASAASWRSRRSCPWLTVEYSPASIMASCTSSVRLSAVSRLKS
jgi:hypothetical protein